MDLKKMRRAVDAYSDGASAADRARLEFFAGLYGLQAEWSERIAESCTYAAPAAEQVEAWYWDRKAVLSQAPVEVDAVLFAEALSAMGAYMAENAGLEPTVAEGLKAYDWKVFCNSVDVGVAGRDPASFVEMCLSGIDKFGVPADVPAAIFALVVTFALRAWLQKPSEAVMAVAPKDHRKHDCPLDCPVCGTPAAASFVGESAGSDGKGRMQYCAACGAQWYFERIRCGVCGTQNQGKLHYFNLEGDNAHRIQSCDACGQYQRVVFQEDIPSVLCMEVEDVVMAKLDQVALDPRFRKEAE